MSVSPWPVTYLAVRDVPELDLRLGDLIWYDPRVERPVRIIRYPFANHGAILGAVEDGAIQPLAGALYPALPSALHPQRPEESAPLPLRLVR